MDIGERYQHLRLLEAVLFASAEPVSARDLQRRLPDDVEVDPLLEELQRHYASRGVTLVRVGTGWAIRTAEDLAEALRPEKPVQRKLSRAALETLAVIAYHQPATRAEIEAIRGVGVARGTLDQLLEAGWIKPGRRRETPGRPATWITTNGFLDHFGLERLADLPGLEELRAAGLLEREAAPLFAAADMMED